MERGEERERRERERDIEGEVMMEGKEKGADCIVRQYCWGHGRRITSLTHLWPSDMQADAP